MVINYPMNWQVLKHPNKRGELLYCLGELASNKSEISKNDAFDIDDIYHFFFDDTDMFDDINSEVGYIFFDSSETEQVMKLVQLLNRILDDVGDKSNERFYKHKQWNEVVTISETAYKLLSIKGLPQY